MRGISGVFFLHLYREKDVIIIIDSNKKGKWPLFNFPGRVSFHVIL